MKKTSAKTERAGAAAASGGALGVYRAKRDPTRTVEPFSAERPGSPGETWSGAFVVHLHDATRRHYDVRLQVGGTLKSFAVPKGPSLDPANKHLAIHTEDHPLEYLDFEAVIPDGNYGAGPMIVWDSGRVRYLESSGEEGLRRGKLDFELSGHKLHGHFALVATGARRSRAGERGAENQWLLLKKTDAWSSTERDPVRDEPFSVLSGLAVEELERKDEVAAALEAEAARLGAPEGDVDTSEMVPMPCAPEGAGLSDAGRIYELKLDGVRIVADKRGEDVALRYRKARPATASYPEVVRALRALAPARLVLDGEVVAFDERGRPSFQRLGPRIHARRAADVRLLAAEIPVLYVAFDLLQIGRRDLTGLPLLDRKRLLASLLRGRGVLRALDHLPDGRALWELVRENRLEGVVAKRADSPYRPGPRRSGDWVKLRAEREDDFVLVGWQDGRGSRDVGALLIASWSGPRLLLRGKVGSGLDARTLSLLSQRMKPSPQRAEGEPLDPQRAAHWIEPEIVVGVEYLGWSEDGRLRQPVFRGIRDDVEPSECHAAPPEELALRAAEQAERPRAEPVAASRRVQLSNRDKLFWPADGYTKGDLLDYYAAIAPVLLPFLAERPIVLVRHPDGIEGKSFYQWNAPEGTPPWVRTLVVRDEEHDGKHVETFLVDDVDSLLHVVNLGCIPIHVLACRERDRESCDFLTIDLDLKSAPFRHAVTLALSLRTLLDEIGFSGFPKTSGQSGLHVLIPLGPSVGFPVAKALCELLGRLLVAQHPDVATMERRIDARGGRVYVDTGQTGRSRTIVAPYSVRAVRGATVSTPLAWDELHVSLDPSRFTMLTVPDRVRELGDPMAGLLAARPDVAAAVAALEKMVGGP